MQMANRWLSSTPMLQIMDSGVMRGADNAYLDQVALASHAAGDLADQLRFYRNQPTASIGRYQVCRHEIRSDYCHDRQIAVIRRVTGGGALYLSPDQLCWSLLVDRSVLGASAGLAEILAGFAGAVASGLRTIGVPASFKAFNDLDIDGRKPGSVFVATAGCSVLLQGVLLLDADVETMLKVLRAPTEKLSRDGLAAARDRLVTLRECLGEDVPVQTVRAAVCAGLADWLDLPMEDPSALADCPVAVPDSTGMLAVDAPLWHTDNDASCMEALWKCDGATLRVRAMLTNGEIGQCALAGDWHADPSDWPERLQQMLNGVSLPEAAHLTAGFCAEHRVDMPGVSATDWHRLLAILADKAILRATTGLDVSQGNALMLFDPEGEGGQEILRKATVMLVPYCAKPVWCKWRQRDGCPECGLCAVGEAYRLARERNMRVTSIVNYEHLEHTLTDMRNTGVESYVGMCCNSFFIKRQRAFRNAGMSAVLMDISGANCYELQQENLAYAGQFRAEAQLDLDALQRVIRIVPINHRSQPHVSCQSDT